MKNIDATEIAWKNGYKNGKEDAVVHGRWEYHWFDSYCSVCGWENKADSVTRCRNDYPYCPICGTKMDGEKEETNSSGISQRTVQALERMGQKVHKSDF